MVHLYETLAQDPRYPDPGNLVLSEGKHDMARLFSVVNEDPALFRMAIGYVLTAPRIPQRYYGTEILMASTTQGRDAPPYRRDFAGGWAGDAVNEFTGAGLSRQQLEAQAVVKNMLNWRKTQPVIHRGKTMQYGPEGDTYVYFRYDGAKKVMLRFNAGKSDATLPTARFHEMLAGVRGGLDVVTGEAYALDRAVTLPARSVLVPELHS